MKIPKSIKIGGMIYKVEITDINDDLGITDFRTSTIKISKDLNDSQKLAAFLHEMTHCLNTQLTEEQVDYLSLSLNQIIVDNKLN